MYHNPYEDYAAAPVAEKGSTASDALPLTLTVLAVGSAFYLLFRFTLGADQPSRRRNPRRRR